MTILSYCACAACARGVSSVEQSGTQALSGQKSTVIATSISGDYRIDVLLDNADSRWNNASPVGSPVEVTYSFAKSPPTYGSAADLKGWSEFTAEQIIVQREIFARISEVANITFREVADSPTSYGQIRLHNNDQGSTSGGYAYFPDMPTDQAGDVFINNATPSNLSGITKGSYAYSLAVHELLHAIGIKHPGNYNAGEPAQPVPGNFLIETEDNYSNSIMSYIALGDQRLQRDFLGPFDQLALQYLYGAKVVRPGNDSYVLTETSGTYLSMINDSGGRDTLDASRSSVGATINLNQGASSSVGRTAAGDAAFNNVQIAFGSVIEEAFGTPFSDRMTGNTSNNVFRSNGGSDTIDGAGGIDRIIVDVARASAGRNGDLLTIGSETLTLTSVERVTFSDALVAFDTGATGNAGSVFRLYQAAFNRTPDLGGVSFWTNAFDNGTPLANIAVGFTSSQEFKTVYGVAPSNTQIVNTYYQNVLARPGEAAGVEFWVGRLNAGATIDNILLNFSNSPENIERTAPSLTNGLLLDSSAFTFV